jgi:hypothetical protein
MPETSIIYSGFYDFPLGFVASHENQQYLFWREFDDEFDEYQDEYEVFILPSLSEDEIKKGWISLREKARPYGKIPVKQVVFDSTHRLSVDTITFDRIIVQ